MNPCQMLMEEMPFASKFTSDEIAALCSDGLGPKVVETGDFLIQEGERDRDIWLLLKGQFNVVKQQMSNMALGVLYVGSFCGEISWFTGNPRTASVIAAEPGLALRLRYDAVHSYDSVLLMKIYHNVLADVIKRKGIMYEILFKLATLERAQFGGLLATSPVGYLRGIPFFAGFNSAEVAFLRSMPMERIRMGEFIFKQGELGDSFFVLLKGSVMNTLNQDPGLVLVNLGPERLMGMDGFFGNGVHGSNCIAVEACEGFRISLKIFQELAPDFKVKLYWQMALNLINRLAPLNIAKIKLEHMEGKMWFGG
ncbi:MAG: cyclic nucleotide-binding domain-containing protein [Magnetococcales bacterium]|nr:cyclic nucleotide-binding domain-containing protein [Magnetococcales bacterium]MBF0439283.1 cyclic nucleotide-binding domain-containing protein [Magnetococcales bacterium]